MPRVSLIVTTSWWQCKSWRGKQYDRFPGYSTEFMYFIHPFIRWWHSSDCLSWRCDKHTICQSGLAVGTVGSTCYSLFFQGNVFPLPDRFCICLTSYNPYLQLTGRVKVMILHFTCNVFVTKSIPVKTRGFNIFFWLGTSTSDSNSQSVIKLRERSGFAKPATVNTVF